MKSEEKDKLQEVFDKYQKENPMKLSDNFDKNFEEMIAKHERRKNNIFFQPAFKYAIAGVLLFVVTIFYFSDSSNSTSNRPNLIAEKNDSTSITENDTSLTVDKKTKEEIKKVIEQPQNLLAANYNPINFEDNPILEGYYGQMRANVGCEIKSPKHGKVFNYKENGNTVLFNGTIKNTDGKSIELLIKVYRGSNQKPQFKKVISVSNKNTFSFTHKFNIPGQYSWKVVTDSEIIFAGNFFIGKYSTK